MVLCAPCWRGGRVAEGAPLLRAYGRNLIEGSNPSLSATNLDASFKMCYALLAQLDRVPGYEPGGRRFESSRARQLTSHLSLFICLASLLKLLFKPSSF